MSSTATIAPRLGSAAEAVAARDAFAESPTDSVIQRDRSWALRVAELQRFDATGLAAITVPERDGGPDLPMTTLVEVIRRIAAVDPALAQAPQAHYLMVDVLAVWGDDHQRATLFSEVLAGGRLGNALA